MKRPPKVEAARRRACSSCSTVTPSAASPWPRSLCGRAKRALAAAWVRVGVGVWVGVRVRVSRRAKRTLAAACEECAKAHVFGRARAQGSVEDQGEGEGEGCVCLREVREGCLFEWLKHEPRDEGA